MRTFKHIGRRPEPSRAIIFKILIPWPKWNLKIRKTLSYRKFENILDFKVSILNLKNKF